MKRREVIVESALDEVTDVSRFYSDDQGPGDVTDNIFKLMDMLDAAKRGLGIANRLKNREDKRANVRMVLINLNKIRGALAHVEKII